LHKRRSLAKERSVKTILKALKLHTVCEEALCPNIGECFHKGVATFMILGNRCTRRCRFCAVEEGVPQAVVADEVERIEEAVRVLNLRYVVVTSPTRDDLADKGAGAFSHLVKRLRELSCVERIEVLIPDLDARKDLIHMVTDAKPDVISHNLETVPSLYDSVRPHSSYERSLEVLKQVKAIDQTIHTKSGIMLGLGEKEQEVVCVLEDLRSVGCDFISIGQYLQPTRNHFPVQEYISQDRFDYYRNIAHGLGFRAIQSSPYTRSSYLAHTYFSL